MGADDLRIRGGTGREPLSNHGYVVIENLIVARGSSATGRTNGLSLTFLVTAIAGALGAILLSW